MTPWSTVHLSWHRRQVSKGTPASWPSKGGHYGATRSIANGGRKTGMR